MNDEAALAYLVAVAIEEYINQRPDHLPDIELLDVIKALDAVKNSVIETTINSTDEISKLRLVN